MWPKWEIFEKLIYVAPHMLLSVTKEFFGGGNMSVYRAPEGFWNVVLYDHETHAI